MKMLTFGTMPSKSAFHAAWQKHMTDSPDGYSYTLRGEDAQSARRARVPLQGTFSERQLYGTVKKLRDGFNKGDENAGSLASAILGHFGYEWV